MIFPVSLVVADQVGLSLVFLTNPMPAKKKMAPTIPNAAMIFMFAVPVPPFTKLMAAYTIPATPNKDKIMPNTRFSIVVFLQGSFINLILKFCRPECENLAKKAKNCVKAKLR